MAQSAFSPRRLPAHRAGGILSPYLSAATVATTSSHLFGDRAKTVCAWLAIAAHHAGQDSDYRLWLAAFKRLQPSKILSRI